MTDKPTQADVELIEACAWAAHGAIVELSGKNNLAPCDYSEAVCKAIRAIPRQPDPSLEKLERVKDALRRIRNIEKPIPSDDFSLAKHQWKITAEQMAETAVEALAMLEEG